MPVVASPPCPRPRARCWRRALAHSYRLVFLTNAGLCAVAAVLLATMREKPLRDEPAYTVRQRAAE